jgi:hypothetical protein
MGAGRRLLPVALLAGLLSAACTTPDDGAPTGSPATPGGPDVVVVRDEPYAAMTRGGPWMPAAMDVYAPRDAAGSDVVLVVPAAGVAAAGGEAEGLGRVLAESGLTAAVATWGVPVEQGIAAGAPVEDVVADVRRSTAMVGCALDYLAETTGQAADRDRRLYVVGHHTGANAAAMATMADVDYLDGCLATPDDTVVTAAVLWDGDWLGSVAGDRLGEDVSRFLEAWSPWPSVDRLSTRSLALIGTVTGGSLVPDIPAEDAAAFLGPRDPSGAIRAELDRGNPPFEGGAFEDGAATSAEVARAFGRSLEEDGVPTLGADGGTGLDAVTRGLTVDLLHEDLRASS